MLSKRIFDILVSLFGIIALLPFLFVIAILIIIKIGRPIFFTQERIGRYGKSFSLVKFRTMMEGHDGGSVSIMGESRITSLGAILRKYKLDELPELWNVIKGDMSLVGPRPDVSGYADRLIGKNREILEIRPGITGPASLKYFHEEKLLSQQPDPIKYNDEVIFPDKVRINLNYKRHRTFYLDLKIIFFTIIRKKMG